MRGLPTLIFVASTLTLSGAASSQFNSSQDLAIEHSCRYMGSVHKESRMLIEVLRACEAISDEEWECMARALKSLDVKFTAECVKRSVDYAEIAADQKTRYARCLPRPRPELLECTLLAKNPRRRPTRCCP